MWELVTGLFFPSKDQEWRKSVSFLVCIFGGLTIMNTWLMWGLFPVSLVFAGFASAEGLKGTEKAIQRVERSIHAQSDQMIRDKNENRALMLFGQLNQVYDAMCGAYRGNRQDEARAWENQFTNLLAEYQRVSGQPYPMRRCG